MAPNEANLSQRPIRLGSAMLLVLGAMLPATIVIPVVRKLVSATWPSGEWVMHAFIAVNLLGACLGGPLLAMRAERARRRRHMAAASIALDGVFLLLVASAPPLWLMLLFRFFQGAVYIAGVSILMGSIRRSSKSAAAMGAVGCSAILAILLGIPLGGILGQVSAAMPLYVGGAIGLSTGVLALFLMPKASEAPASGSSFRELIALPGVRAPATIVALERFAVGAFIVTLQLYGHHVLKVSDRQVSMWFSIFLTVFAFGTWPMARLGDRIDRWKLVAFGAVAYGASFVALGSSVASISVVLAFGGLASAAIYGPSLGLTAQSVSDRSRGSAMAILNAAGTFGMFLGSTASGIVSQLMLNSGVERAEAYTTIFVLAGASQVVSVVVAVRSSRLKTTSTPVYVES